MVSIGGLNLNTSGLFSKFGSYFSYFIYGILGLIVVGLIGWFIWAKIRNKVYFRDPITLTRIYDNGTEDTIYGMWGGRYVGKQGAWEYRVKIPKQRKAKELGYLPDFSRADKDGSLHFTTCGDGTYWQQTEWKTISKEVVGEEGEKQTILELIKKPVVSSDEKNIMIKDIRSWREVVAKNKLTAFSIGLGMFLIMVIAHLISLYIQTKIRCPVA